ncbi:hypothetical protein ACINK0_13415 [Deinococcus sp. VB343]|uniref:Uncharacterized protein n=1 Tax=Deinococcus sp. VB142 TaxID=3112952 RepID=A0AAU6Q2S1_9DEIO
MNQQRNKGLRRQGSYALYTPFRAQNHKLVGTAFAVSDPLQKAFQTGLNLSGVGMQDKGIGKGGERSAFND